MKRDFLKNGVAVFMEKDRLKQFSFTKAVPTFSRSHKRRQQQPLKDGAM